MDEPVSRPQGYIEPFVTWLVEYDDPRQPREGTFQAGGFTTETEAQKLKDHLETEGFFAELRLNMAPIHSRLEDWLWDR